MIVQLLPAGHQMGRIGRVVLTVELMLPLGGPASKTLLPKAPKYIRSRWCSDSILKGCAL